MFNGKKFVEIARAILADAQFHREAGYRTVVGRAYYSCFHVTYRWLRGKGWREKGTRSLHKQVGDELRKYDPYAANLLKSLFDLRVLSDYRLKRVVDDSHAKKSILLSEQIEKLLPP